MSVPGQTPPASPTGSPMREFIAPVLSLIIGVFVLLPTAIGPIGRPFALGWLLPAFVTLAVISGIGLVVALLASNWEGAGALKVMHVGHGTGNWAGVLSLIAAAAFLGWNYREDTVATPRIVNVKVNPAQPEAGKVVEIELEVANRAGVLLTYDWDFEGKKVAGLRTAYVKMPAEPGTYVATATVRSSHLPQLLLDAGAAMQAGSLRPVDGASSVRVSLDVVLAEKPHSANTTNATNAPQSIVQVEKDHARTEKNVAHRKTNSKSASARTQVCR